MMYESTRPLHVGVAALNLTHLVLICFSVFTGEIQEARPAAPIAADVAVCSLLIFGMNAASALLAIRGGRA